MKLIPLVTSKIAEKKIDWKTFSGSIFGPQQKLTGQNRISRHLNRIYWLELPPNQDASHKWRFLLGFPTKNGIILAVFQDTLIYFGCLRIYMRNIPIKNKRPWAIYKTGGIKSFNPTQTNPPTQKHPFFGSVFLQPKKKVASFTINPCPLLWWQATWKFHTDDMLQIFVFGCKLPQRHGWFGSCCVGKEVKISPALNGWPKHTKPDLCRM